MHRLHLLIFGLDFFFQGGLGLFSLHCIRYLDMLPKTFGNPLWFTDDELLELKGTTLYRATELQVTHVFACPVLH